MDQISIKLIEHLESGGVVAYPTSTLPGLGSLPSKKGLDKLFSLKKRSEDQPVSLGVFSLQQAEDLVEVPNFAKTLLENFPLGSITLILDAKEKLDSRLGGNRVAIRVFSNPVARMLAEAVGPVTATSANPSGVEPSNIVSIAAKSIELSSDFVLEGTCPGGKGSTILSIDKNESESCGFSVTIMREGVVPRADVMAWMRKIR